MNNTSNHSIAAITLGYPGDSRNPSTRTRASPSERVRANDLVHHLWGRGLWVPWYVKRFGETGSASYALNFEPHNTSSTGQYYQGISSQLISLLFRLLLGDGHK